MADITISCPGCGNQITISEFVDAEFLVCIKCKAKVTVPKREPPPPAAAGLRLAALPTLPPVPIAPPPAPKKKLFSFGRSTPPPVVSGGPAAERRANLPSTKKRTNRRRGSGVMGTVLPWIIFAVLGLALAWARYWPGALSAKHLELFILGGIWALVALHVFVIVDAFNDEAFQGVLCAMLPGYSVYYLFVNSDQYFLRGIAAAALIAFGWDASLAGIKRSQEMHHTITVWIEGADTTAKKLPLK